MVINEGGNGALFCLVTIHSSDIFERCKRIVFLLVNGASVLSFLLSVIFVCDDPYQTFFFQ